MKSAKPNFTSAISGNTFVAPGDFATIYDVQSLYNAGIDGTGQSIAVMGQTDLYQQRQRHHRFPQLPRGCRQISPTIILIPGATDPGVTSQGISTKPAWTSSGRAPWPGTPQSSMSTGVRRKRWRL